MSAFLAQWKKIKTDYEAATDRKKPSDTFMGVFKAKNGLESGFTALDAAVKKPDMKVAQDALETLQKSALAYRKVLVKAAVAEKNKDIQKETNKMMDRLEELVESSKVSIEDLIDALLLSMPNPEKVLPVGSLSAFSALMKTPAFNRIKAFAKKKFRTETMNFLIAMVAKDYTVATFKTYLKDNDLNLSSSIIAKFDEADLTNAPWDLATTEALVLFNTNIVRPINSERAA